MFQTAGIRHTDIIDLRPRVNDYSVTEGARSPFEFLEDLSLMEITVLLIFADGESILLDYSYYLPRIDRIYLTKDGAFCCKKWNTC